MEQNPQQSNQPNPPQEETIFDESEILGSGYDKYERRARNVLFIIAGIQVLSGFFTSAQANAPEPVYIWTEVGIIGGIFIGLGIWSIKSPYYAILTGLIVYILYQILLMVLDPRNIYYGILVKIVIVVFLIMGMKNAYEAKKLKDALKNK